MIAAAFVVAGAAMAWLAHRRWLVVVVRGGSMAPTLRDGQQLLVRRGRAYRRGDLVVFRPPRPRGALDDALDDALGDAPDDAPGDAPGDTPGDALGDAPDDAPGDAPGDALGDAPGDPPYRIKRVAAVAGDALPPWLPRAGVSRVPPRHLVVSGDHPISEDSRHFGFVPDDAVLGTLRRPAPRPARPPAERVAPSPGWARPSARGRDDERGGEPSARNPAAYRRVSRRGKRTAALRAQREEAPDRRILTMLGGRGSPGDSQVAARWQPKMKRAAFAAFSRRCLGWR